MQSENANISSGSDVLGGNSNASKLLHFSLNAQNYMIPLDIVKEVIRYEYVTKVPTVPEVVHGVFNLRGTYVPVVDLAKRLVLTDNSVINAKSCILITECQSESQTVPVGLLVDEVHEAVNIQNLTISEAPKFGHSISVELIKGMFRRNDTDYIILDVDKLLDLDELIQLLENLDDEALIEE